MPGSEMVAVLLRIVLVAVLAMKLMLVDRGDSTWVNDTVPALALATALAFAVVTEPRPWLRRTLLVLVVLLYAAWMLRDGAWHAEWFWIQYTLLSLTEAVLIAPFLETRLWRWSLAPGFVLGAWLLYHLLPGYGNDVVTRHATWLVQALLLLAIGGGRRAMHAEDEEFRSRIVEG